MRTTTEGVHAGPADPRMEQESLAQYLARAGRLPILQGFALAVQLLANLDAAHRRGLAVGDVSIPALRINRAGRLLVPSTGEASAEEGPRPPRRPGEIERDLFSAAEVAYELLTGAPPSLGPSGGGTAPAHASETPVPVRARRAELPPALDAVFARALAARPGSRYPSAAEFSEALQAAMPQPRWDRNVPVSAPVNVGVPTRPAAPATVTARVSPAPAALPVTTGRRRRFGLALASGVATTVLAVALWTGLDPASVSGSHETPAAAPAQATETLQAIERTELAAHVPAAPSIDVQAPEAAPEEPDTDAQPVAATSAARPERRHAAPAERKPATAAPTVHARAGRSDARRAMPFHRPVVPKVVQVVHSLPPGPQAACRQDFAIAPDVCTAFRCATSEFRHHPVCVRMHAEGARARAQLAESRGGP